MNKSTRPRRGRRGARCPQCDLEMVNRVCLNCGRGNFSRLVSSEDIHLRRRHAYYELFDQHKPFLVLLTKLAGQEAAGKHPSDSALDAIVRDWHLPQRTGRADLRRAISTIHLGSAPEQVRLRRVVAGTGPRPDLTTEIVASSPLPFVYDPLSHSKAWARAMADATGKAITKSMIKGIEAAEKTAAAHGYAEMPTLYRGDGINKGAIWLFQHAVLEETYSTIAKSAGDVGPTEQTVAETVRDWALDLGVRLD